MLNSLGQAAYSDILERHHALIREAIKAHDGVEVSTEGDSFFAVFSGATDAAGAAVSMQHGVMGEPWPYGVSPAIRIGLHTGTAHIGGDNYIGVDVHRAARLATAAHGGQVVLSSVTAEIVDGQLPDGVTKRELGKYRLADLQQAESIHQLVISGLPSDFPFLRGAQALSSLPAPLTDFLGREDELAKGSALLAQHRLITLTGPGGTGKTRLSIELARRNEGYFPDGAFFVPLAQISEPGLLPNTILDSLGVTSKGTDPNDHLIRFMSDKKTLLVLDNFEQIQGGAAWVAVMLGLAPDVKVLLTSRAPLRIVGERQLAVPPLPIPDTDIRRAEEATAYPGMRLFAARAAAVRPGFHLNDGNVSTVAAITTKLDGLPLAIELAASRMRTLTPELILERLDNRLLSTGASDLPARQQTIVDAIGWSYDLLDPLQKRLFERCSVFSGSFDLRAAETVAGDKDGRSDVLEGLVGLVENSLLVQPEISGEPRFRMLTVIKEYGSAALLARGDDQQIMARHARTYLGIAEEAAAEILTSRQREYLERLSLEHDNLRAAIDWSVREGEASIALRLVASLWRFWQMRGHILEAEQRVESALSLLGGSPEERAAALTALGGLKYWHGQWQETLEPYSRAAELLSSQPQTIEYAEALYNLSFTVSVERTFEEGTELALESLRIADSLDNQLGVGRAYWSLSNIAALSEDWDSMYVHAQHAADIFSKSDAPFDLGWAWFMMALGLARKGEYRSATPHALKALEIFAEAVDLSAITLVLENLGYIAFGENQTVVAAKIAGVANRLKVETGAAIGDVPFNQYPEYVEFLRLGDEVVQAAYEEGQALSIDEALELAREAVT